VDLERGPIVDEPEHDPVQVVDIDEEPVVPMGAVEDRELRVGEPIRHRPHLGHRVQHVGADPHDQRLRTNSAEYSLERSTSPTEIVAVHRADQREVCVGIEPLDEPGPVMPKV
jgi:hypothetical protein